MAVQQPILETGTEVSRYRVEGLVARGGMGLVYRARDVRLDRPVALKVLSPELSDDDRFRERFVRESRLAAAVDHPNVIPVYEADDWDGLLFIAMRFVEGVDLHTVLATTGPMDPGVALPLLAQAAAALDAAHRLGLVHRDVKPGNFMLAGAAADRVPPGTHVYLTDFGLTKRATSVSGLTRTGQFLGSLHYVAPEQIRGEEVDARTDVYALACVAFEMLTGRPPFDMDGEAGLLWAHMSTPPPSLCAVRADLPGAVDAVVSRGMAKDPADRPATCAEFVAGLRSALVAAHDGAQAVRAAPTQVVGSQEASTSPHPGAAHPSFPPGVPVGVSPDAAQRREQTPVHPPAGWLPVASGPPPGGAPPWGGGQPPPAGRAGRRWWPWAVLALVVVLAAVAAIWRPWSGPSLVAEDFVVVPFQADVPDDWETYTVTGDLAYAVLGARDWTGLSADDGTAVADAETALTDDPESLVHLYVDGSDNVYTSDAKGLADQLQSGFDNARMVAQGTRQVDGRDAFAASGVVPLGDGQLRVYAVTLQDEPRLLMVFIAPSELYDEWKPTFDAVVDSVTFTG